jgi:hypothetical protein
MRRPERVKQKNALSKKLSKGNNQEVRKEYNRVRNEVKTAVNKLKKQYEKRISIQAKENPKVIWNYYKSKTKVEEGIRELHIDPDNIRSAKTDDDKEKADILADYFSNVFTKESDGPAPHLENKEIKTKLKNLHIDEEIITKMLLQLKIDKSPVQDELQCVT